MSRRYRDSRFTLAARNSFGLNRYWHLFELVAIVYIQWNRGREESSVTFRLIYLLIFCLTGNFLPVKCLPRP